MTVPFLMTAASGVHADEAQTSSDYLTIGAGGRYAPRYSGSDKQVWQGVPVLQGRKGAFFIDAQKGIGYDLQNDSGVYLEHTLGYDLGRADENSNWREGANNLKGMGEIDTSLNTGLAVGWQITSWLSVEGKATLPVTDSQGKLPGLCYAAPSTNQSGHDCFSVCIPVWRQALPQYGMGSVSSRVSAPVIAVIQRPVDSTV